MAISSIIRAFLFDPSMTQFINVCLCHNTTIYKTLLYGVNKTVLHLVFFISLLMSKPHVLNKSSSIVEYALLYDLLWDLNVAGVFCGCIHIEIWRDLETPIYVKSIYMVSQRRSVAQGLPCHILEKQALIYEK